MRDPFAWSIPLGRMFGITVRVHVLFPIVALGLILRFALQEPKLYYPGTWIDATLILALLFLSVLLHEFGHCFGARAVNGDAQEVLLWPLGGLAQLEVPNTPRANLITTLAGPGVNLILALGCLIALAFIDPSLRPSFNPFYFPARELGGKFILSTWTGSEIAVSPYAFSAMLTRFFWVNYVLFLLNVVLIGFPLDGGRIFQCILWHYVGYRRATLAAVFAGFLTMLVVGLASIVWNELLPLCLAIFIYVSCKQQYIILESDGEASLFGYDFSQGYTSLERDQPAAAPPRKRQSWWQRWWQRRQAKKMQKEEEQRIAEEQRLDELLDKVAREGMAALTDEERRFMKRVSDRYRNNRHS